MLSGGPAGGRKKISQGAVNWAARLAERNKTPSDFSLSNYAYMAETSGNTTDYRGVGACGYYLRSAASRETTAFHISNTASLSTNGTAVNKNDTGVRPALRLSL